MIKIYENLDINDLDREIWKYILDYEGDYQVSNVGRVKSLKFGKERILKQYKDGGSYFKVGLSKNGESRQKLVHRLVYETFKEKLEDGYDAHHINEDEEDNYFENLKSEKHSKHIENHRKNKKHSEKTKSRMSDTRKEKFKNGELDFKDKNHPMFGKHHSLKTKNKISEKQPNKISNQKYTNIEIDIKNGILTQNEMVKKHNVCRSTICKINKLTSLNK
jgi:hypothetical protein